MIEGFKSLLAWQEAIILLTMIAEIIREFRGPDSQRAAGQLLSAAESVPSNIAEGYGKGFCPDNLRFLRIALSSLDEVESRLLSAVAAGRISRERIGPALRQAQRVRSLLRGYMRYVEGKIASHP